MKPWPQFRWARIPIDTLIHYLVGGFNPFEKYARQTGNLPQVGVNIKHIWVATNQIQPVICLGHFSFPHLWHQQFVRQLLGRATFHVAKNRRFGTSRMHGYRFVRHFGYPTFKHKFQVGLYTIRSVGQEVIRSMIISGWNSQKTDISFENRPSNNTPRIHPENEWMAPKKGLFQ